MKSSPKELQQIIRQGSPLCVKYTMKIAALVLLALSLTSMIHLEVNAAENKSSEDATADAGKAVVQVEPPGLRNDRLLAEQLGDSKAKWLTAGNTKFLGIFNADTSGKSVGSLLILPMTGRSAKSPGLLTQLINEVSSKGWHTLGISLPQFDFSGPFPSFPKTKKIDEPSDEQTSDKETAPTEPQIIIPEENKWYADQETKNMGTLLERILAAESELLAKGGQYVVLAQGATAELVLELISSKVIKPVGLITLNIQHPISQRSSQIATNLAAVKIPILDIYNLSDNGAAKERKVKQNGENYRQINIPGNDIDFHGSELLVIKRIRGWLKNNFSKAS